MDMEPVNFRIKWIDGRPIRQFKYELVIKQDREYFYFNGINGLHSIEDLGDDFKKLCHKANELNRIDAEWGIHHWVRPRSTDHNKRTRLMECQCS